MESDAHRRRKFGVNGIFARKDFGKILLDRAENQNLKCPHYQTFNAGIFFFGI
jgi:hypothetical protein